MPAQPSGRERGRYRASVADASGLSWWEDFNTGLRLHREAGGQSVLPELSDKICELLDSVDVAFAVAGADTPSWSNPWPNGRIPDSASYEQVTDPGKFLIVRARAKAWIEVLIARGWARQLGRVEWALAPFDAGGVSTMLKPDAAGAVPLVVTVHEPVDSAHVPTLTLAAGDPAVMLASIPDCGCDGCDRGSADLLEEVDRWVLSVIDGSLEVELGDEFLQIRTSFGSQSNTVQHSVRPAAFSAAPWPADWQARPLVPTPKSRRRWS